MFLVQGVISPPHFVTGNKMRFEKVGELLNFLFLWEDGEERAGWGSKPYRAILQKSFELIEQRLGYRKAERWLDEFLHLVRLTHWILPYPSNRGLISATKSNRSQGLKRRMMWFSAVYAEPEKVAFPGDSMPCTLHNIFWKARRQTFGDGGTGQEWGTSQLINACRGQGVLIYGLEEAKDYWVIGKKSAGMKGFLPVWERSQPPKLKMLEQIRNKSLDELDELIVELNLEHGNEQNVEEGGENSGEEAEVRSSDGSENHEGIERDSFEATVSTGSIFVPSASEM